MEIRIPNYFSIRIETDDSSVFEGVYFFMGDSFVAFNKEQWIQFQEIIATVHPVGCERISNGKDKSL